MPPTKLKPLSAELIAQIHPTLNGELDYSTIGAKSSLTVWWECTLHGHPYLATPGHKTAGAGCSVCAGKQIHAGFNDIQTTHPDVAKLWHPTKNGELTPEKVSKGSGKKVWWQCELGHDFFSTPANVKPTTCATCSGKVLLKGFNDAQTVKPALAKYFNAEKNGFAYDEIRANHPQKIIWDNACGHESEVLILNCSEDSIPCSYCNNKKTLAGFNDVATTNPELKEIWYSTKNGGLALTEFNKGHKASLWWKCEQGHEWEGRVANQLMKKSLCSYCAGTLIIAGENDLMTLKPELMVEWNHDLNVGVDVTALAPYSGAKYWWKCEQGHEWESSCTNRFRGTGCPYCSGNKTQKGINTLGDKFPEIAEEWDYSKNGEVSPYDVHSGANSLAFWKCRDGHEWRAKIADRTRYRADRNNEGSICQQCSHLLVNNSSETLLEAYPELAKEWHPTKNLLTPETIASKSNRSVWWLGKCGHEWECALAQRTDKKSNCPECWRANLCSAAENELAEFVEALGLTITKNDRKTMGNRQDLDIFIPEKRFAIEYNGLFWHTEESGKDRKYHASKTAACQDKGIQLFMVWEDDWLNRKDIVKRSIASRLGKLDALAKMDGFENSNKRINARSCVVEAIIYKEAESFHAKNHIQGGNRSTHYFGLFHQGALVAVGNFGKSGVDGEYLIARYSSEGIIRGGFSKILSHAEKQIPVKQWATFADLSFSDGGLYDSLGFTLDSVLRPDYSYVVERKREHKFGYRLKRFESDESLIYLPNHTESQLAKLNGMARIWDCGKARYTKIVS